MASKAVKCKVKGAEGTIEFDAMKLDMSGKLGQAVAMSVNTMREHIVDMLAPVDMKTEERKANFVSGVNLQIDKFIKNFGSISAQKLSYKLRNGLKKEKAPRASKSEKAIDI